MSEQTFEDRIAALEEHIVTEDPSADEFLARAERALAKGDQAEAHHCLCMAKIRSVVGRLGARVDYLEEEEDDDA